MFIMYKEARRTPFNASPRPLPREGRAD